MPFLLYVVYPCVLWSAWLEQITGCAPPFKQSEWRIGSGE
jgi:hypothetical protein